MQQNSYRINRTKWYFPCISFNYSLIATRLLNNNLLRTICWQSKFGTINFPFVFGLFFVSNVIDWNDWNIYCAGSLYKSFVRTVNYTYYYILTYYKWLCYEVLHPGYILYPCHSYITHVFSVCHLCYFLICFTMYFLRINVPPSLYYTSYVQSKQFSPLSKSIYYFIS